MWVDFYSYEFEEFIFEVVENVLFEVFEDFFSDKICEYEVVLFEEFEEMEEIFVGRVIVLFEFVDYYIEYFLVIIMYEVCVKVRIYEF